MGVRGRSRLLALLSLAATVVGCYEVDFAGNARARSSVVGNAAADYFPLATGWKWTYAVWKDGVKIPVLHEVLERQGDVAVVQEGGERITYVVTPEGIAEKNGDRIGDYIIKNPVRAVELPMYAGQKGLTEYETVQSTIDDTNRSVTMTPALIGPAEGTVHFRGCNVGRSQAFLDKWKEALGNVRVTAPKHFHGISSGPGHGYWEYLVYEFAVNAPGNKLFKTLDDLKAAFDAGGIRACNGGLGRRHRRPASVSASFVSCRTAPQRFVGRDQRIDELGGNRWAAASFLTGACRAKLEREVRWWRVRGKRSESDASRKGGRRLVRDYLVA